MKEDAWRQGWCKLHWWGLTKGIWKTIWAQSLIYLACMTYNGKCMLNVNNLQQFSYAERCLVNNTTSSATFQKQINVKKHKTIVHQSKKVKYLLNWKNVMKNSKQLKPRQGLVFFVICVLCLPNCLICFLQPCAHLLGKGWSLGSPVMFSCVLSLSHVVSCVRCGTWLYWGHYE